MKRNNTMKYKIKITIDTSNSAFDGWNIVSEIESIMDTVKKRLTNVIELDEPVMSGLFDTNGNRAGSVIIVEEE